MIEKIFNIILKGSSAKVAKSRVIYLLQNVIYDQERPEH